MSKLCIVFFTAIVAAASAWSQEAPYSPPRSVFDFVFVEGGTFKHTKSNYYGKGLTVSSFYIGKCEVTQKEWTEVMESNPSQFKGDSLPVEMVSWYDCVEYCNKRSIRDSLKPYYDIDKNKKDPHNQTEIDDVKWTITANAGANGYRLPTEAEWEYAAGGGQKSKSFTYSGSDEVDQVAWYWQNSGDEFLTGGWNWSLVEANNSKSKAVGAKEPNELGIYDMSGNVREWCWDWYGDLKSDGIAPQASSRESGRVWRGGGWMGGDFCCETSFRSSFEANGKGPDQGFRVCRGK